MKTYIIALTLLLASCSKTPTESIPTVEQDSSDNYGFVADLKAQGCSFRVQPDTLGCHIKEDFQGDYEQFLAIVIADYEIEQLQKTETLNLPTRLALVGKRMATSDLLVYGDPSSEHAAHAKQLRIKVLEYKLTSPDMYLQAKTYELLKKIAVSFEIIVHIQGNEISVRKLRSTFDIENVRQYIEHHAQQFKKYQKDQPDEFEHELSNNVFLALSKFIAEESP